MTGARVVFLIGLFIVPLLLLALGHSLRKRSPRVRSAFWGAVTGYFIGVVVVCVVTLTPAVHWDGMLWRDLIVHWSMVLGALLGFAIGAMLAGDAPSGARPGVFVW